MQQLLSTDILLCEGFRLDRLGLSRLDPGGVASPVTLGSRALDLAWLLADRHGELISKDEIMETVWPGRVVEENNLTVQISTLRRILDQARAEGSCIQTVVGHGYRFVAAVTRVAAETLTQVPLLPSGGVNPPPRLSIVVLPFANLSDDPEQQYFADGITEDLTTDLSRLSNMFVISRNTAFTYRKKATDTKQIGRDLGVRYVLEGSVRRSGNQLRVNAQLVDAATDRHLWAERFNGDTSDLFALQDEVTGRIANALGVELIAAEAARRTEHPDALDYILRGRAARLKPNSSEVYAEAISLFERALALDPESVESLSLLANSLVGRVLDGMSGSAAADLERADELIGQTLAAFPRSAYVHLVKGKVLLAQNRWDEAVPEFETALRLNRNLVWALHELAWCRLYAGSIVEVIPLEQQAIRLSPRDPNIGWWYYMIGTVHLLQSHTDGAIGWLEQARSSLPAAPFIRGRLASAYALRGETERASAELAEVRRLDGGDLFSSIAHLKAAPGGWWGAPKTRALFEATYFAGLRKAGMPDE
jgi:adenylate cyclase